MEGIDSTLSQDVSVWYRATVNAIAVDESGQYACLGGKKALYIVDLDDPWEAVKTLHQQSKFEVGTVQFNPHPSHHSYIASTANTNTLIWNLDDRRFALQVTFRSHERPVLDLGWSYGDANLLATCSADMNVVLWDTRSPKSALKLTTITPRAAVHLLKWNRKQTNLMATASNGEIRIWDIRKEKSALTHITAHMGKINAIDWSYNSENELLTAGQDATVKCWDTANPRKEKAIIQAGLPVALASYTPFGGGVVTVAQRDDFCPRLWSLADTSAPIHSFSGENAHADIVTAVEWRTSTKHGEKKYQLVSWSKDQHLKFWKIDQPIFDCLSGRGPSEGDLFTMPGTPVNSLGVPSPRGHRSSPRDEQRVGLTQEFALMRQNPIKGIAIKTLDAAQAYCEATARVGSYMQELKITFPSAYPHSAPPSFHLPPNGTITTRTRNKLKEVLSNTADRYVSVSRPCLEPCLSELISSLEAEAAKNSDLQTPSSSSGLLGLGFEGLGIDSIMGMGPLGMGLGVSSGLAGSGGDDHSPLDRFDATAAGSGLQVGSIDGSNPFGLMTQSSAAKRHGADTSGDRGSGGHKRLATATAGLKAVGSGGGAAVDKLSRGDARVDVDRDHGKRSVDRDHATSSGASGREKGMTTTGGSGAMGGIGRTSSGGSRTRSFSATDTGLTSVSASALLSPTSMSPSSPAIASPSSYYLSSRDESIPAPRTCGVCFGVDGLVEFRSFAGGDSSTQALTASRTYADLKRQLTSRETPSGGMNKNAFVEITKLYFYEEVVDLLPIKMDLSSHGKGAGGQGKGQGSNVLVMRDITALLPISRELAVEYSLTGLSAHDLCAKNCLAAKKVGRKDLVQLWTLVGQLTHDSLYQPSEEGTNGTMTSPKGAKGAMTADDCPWSYHPFGRSLVASLFRYYQSLGDIQTLAMLACVLSFSPNVVAPSSAPTRAMITVQPAMSSVASASTSSFFPSIFRRDQVSSSASADEVPVSTGGKPHRDLKRELSLGNDIFGGKLKNLKRERVNSSSFISQPSVQSSTGSLSFSNIDALTSSSALSTSPGDSSPPPPPPPPSASMRHHHDRIAQSGASLTSASSPTLQSTSLTSSVGELEPLGLNSGVGGDVSTSSGGSSSMLSAASSRLSVGYGRTSSTPNALLSISPSSPSHMRDAAAREHKRSQSLTSKKAAESRRSGPQVENLNSLLDPSKQPLYEHYKRSYGEVLYRWGLLEKRAEVLKLLQTSAKQQSRMCIGLSLACHNCGQPVTGPSPLCTACRMAAFRCALCHTPVRGLSNFCLVCGHGGHMHHMRQWFEKQAFCPSGCGCPCLTHTPSLIS